MTSPDGTAPAGRPHEPGSGGEPERGGLSRRGLLIGGAAAGAIALVGGISFGVAQGSGASGTGRARLIIHNGRVWTGDPARFADAVAIDSAGTIIAVGTLEEVQRFNGPKTESIDAKGGTVMPGVHDSHLHAMAGAEGLSYPSLDNATLSVPELQQRVRAMLEDGDDDPDNWLVIVDWNPAGLTGAVAHRKYLDELGTRRPIFLRGSDFHNGWANSRALEIAGVTASTPSPDGGEIVMDSDGPTGLLKDAALWMVAGMAPELTEAQKKEAHEYGFAFLAGVGVTSFMDAAGPAERAHGFAELVESGVIAQRVSVACGVEAADMADGEADSTLARLGEVRDAYADHPRLSVRTAKVFLDGVAEYPAQTAAMLDPYLDESGAPTDHRGDLYVSEEEFPAMATRLDAEGWQIHTHAIGDRAVRASLDGFERAQAANGGAKHRHTVTHIQFCADSDIPRFAANDVIANMQIQWAAPFSFTLASLEPYVGPERHRKQYPLGSLQAAGADIAGSSDWPVDKLNPWNQIRTGVDRTGTFSETGEALYPEQGISLNESLLMHTRGAAFQLFQEEQTGVIEVGRQADLVVLDRDLFDVPVAEISGTTVNYTIIDGEVVHDIGTKDGQRFANTAAAASGGAFASAYAVGQRHAACCGGTRHA